jgi:SOS response regulatory protein OraA/RecX
MASRSSASDLGGPVVDPSKATRRSSPDERRAKKGEVDDPEVVLNAAARFLEVRPRSIAEVRRQLTRAGYRPELVEGAITRLTELGMLDDGAFAAQWVESRDRAHPRGEHALIIELRQKGIDASIITATLKARREAATRWEDAPASDSPEPIDEAATDPDMAAARKLLERNARALAREPVPRLRRQKAYALLARNGFDPDVCREVSTAFVRESIAEADRDQPE